MFNHIIFKISYVAKNVEQMKSCLVIGEGLICHGQNLVSVKCSRRMRLHLQFRYASALRKPGRFNWHGKFYLGLMDSLNQSFVWFIVVTKIFQNK